MAIAASTAQAILTKNLAAVYKERISPLGFLRSFFPEKISATKFISIAVQRGSEKIAVDITPGTEGNRNSFSKSSEKIFAPPVYREYLDATQLDLYETMFGSTSIEEAQVMQFIEDLADHLGMLQDKIDRRYELQCAQVFDTGIITLTNGTNIDFKRKALSKVDKGAGQYWATATVNPFTDMQTAAKFLRQVGKSQGQVINMICGETAINDLFNNTIFKADADIRRIDRMEIREPQRNSVGGTSHGFVSAGDYIIRIWSYSEFFDDENDVSTPYLDPKNVIFLPENPGFFTGFGAVPQLIDMDNPTIQRGKYIFNDFPDQRKVAHDYDIQSAGVTVPLKIDQIYTLQVVAS